MHALGRRAHTTRYNPSSDIEICAFPILTNVYVPHSKPTILTLRPKAAPIPRVLLTPRIHRIPTPRYTSISHVSRLVREEPIRLIVVALPSTARIAMLYGVCAPRIVLVLTSRVQI